MYSIQVHDLCTYLNNFSYLSERYIMCRLCLFFFPQFSEKCPKAFFKLHENDDKCYLNLIELPR